MLSEFNLRSLLSGLSGYKGLPFPGQVSLPQRTSIPEYEVPTAAGPRQEFTQKGSRLWAQHEGRWYFMPVMLEHKGKSLEIPFAVISISGEKTIVRTPMPGRRGSVKELISMDDAKISLTGLFMSADGSYPEAAVSEMNALIQVNESIKLVSALSDLLLDPEDRVVIQSWDFPPTPGVEDVQAVKLELVSDSPFVLTVTT